jgi:hypothetical protein
MTDITESLVAGKRIAFLHIAGNSPKQNTVIVDFEDMDKLLSGKWYVGTVGYAVCGTTPRKTGKMLLFHRELLNAAPGNKVDHKNGDTLDDRKMNIRECTHRQNMYNCKMSINNTTGYKGVSWNSSRGIYESYITKNGKKIHLGRFDDPVKAALKYNEKAIEFFGEFARLNVIPNN